MGEVRMFAKLGYDLLPYVITIVVALLGFMGRHLGPFLKEKVGEKRLSNVAKNLEIAEQQVQQKKGLAYDAVLWAEDAFKNSGGQEKLSKAINWAMNQANKVGIKATKQELEDAIRIAYTDIKPRLPKEVGLFLDSNSPQDSVKQGENNNDGSEVSQSKDDTSKTSTESQPGAEATQSAPEPAPTPEPVQEVEKPLSEMTSTDLKNVVTQALQDHLKVQSVSPDTQPASV